MLAQVKYPVPVSEDPMALGDGTWLTCGEEDPFQLLMWSLPPMEDPVSSTVIGH